ncbi:plasmid replication DNA-binding protein KfrA [Paraburkholderia eburnea]|uniref:Plasmid replication DNA-binding protein KfrA n=1 Tax=Paraburkholderia eburnea TaxID=1189126 RepID=A0A2S4MFB2_9BURK|nr:DNA-binding protein [Paraburkholderia eburnea]POR53438.1 plasmid replication DNA-binding protein KfrA [Paraburkholderia eburnea]PRZ25406.1 plasmid replication DNA-binding protein KfrA [Paraburkholderia eburnea]
MSRISDTRLRTRETASRLVAAGKRPHELTVDLIYAEIRQGSRTTINDELKQWKDEKTRSDALASQLPPAVADAMLGIWAVAVEHGERVYDARVAELEQTTAQADSRAAEAVHARAAAEETLRLREVELGALTEQIAALKQQLEAANARAEEARIRADALEAQRDAERELADTRQREQRTEHEKASAALRASLEARDAAFQSELDKATQRMEGVQKHMMQQISDAREERRRADALAATLQQRNETLLGELAAARVTQASQDEALRTAQQETEGFARERQDWQRERESLENRLVAIRNRSRAKLKRIAVSAPRGARQ